MLLGYLARERFSRCVCVRFRILIALENREKDKNSSLEAYPFSAPPLGPSAEILQDSLATSLDLTRFGKITWCLTGIDRKSNLQD